MKAFPNRKSLGFTLIELMIGIAILAIVTSLAMPSFREMLRNAEVRNAAESIVSGLQRARAEAVARNANIQFILGPYPPACSGTNSSWTVDYEVKPVPGDPAIDSRCSSEGSNNVTVVATATTSIIFNNLGQPKVGVPASARLAQVDLAAVGSTRNLRVMIGVGGDARMCDPNLASGSSPRAC